MHPDLLAAVIAHPDDDVPRLVLADWLDEHGESERAEFIRVQIELNSCQYTVNDPRWQYLRSRQQVLLHQHRRHWMAPFYMKDGPLHDRVIHAEFVRGFIEIVWMAASTFVQRGELLMDWTTLRELRVTRASTHEACQLFRSEITAQLDTLDFTGRKAVTDYAARVLAGSEHLASIRSLKLTHCNIGDEGAAAIANCQFDWPLVSLDIVGNPISYDAESLLCRRFGGDVVNGHLIPF